MQAALDLGEQGFEVLLAERTPSIGGVMVGLNKVFPTLDCSSCICTPRMAESAHHPRIRLQTYTEVRQVEPAGAGFRVTLECKPRYLNEETCIGCDECERACPVAVPHEFDYGLGARRAIYIPHGNAIPQKAVLDLEHCVFCAKCEKVCPTNCIDFTPGTACRHGDGGHGHRGHRARTPPHGQETGVRRRADAERDEPSGNGAHPVEQRAVRPRAAPSGRQDSPSRSPTSSAPGAATARSAFRTARASAACTR